MQARLITATGLLALLPPLALLLGGRPLEPQFRLPPGYEYQTGGAFSPLGFALLGLTAAALILLAAWHLSRRGSESPLKPAAAPERGLPAHGRVGILLLLGGGLVAIVSASYAAPPLLAGLALWLDADAGRRQGRSLYLAGRGYFFALFPLGALLGWGAEYLNRFVEVWSVVPGRGPWEYGLLVTLHGAALLPATQSARLWLLSLGLPGLAARPSTPRLPGETATLLLLLGGSAGLLAGGLWPEQLYALAWAAPLLLLGAVQRLFAQGAAPDQGRALSAMAGGLLAAGLWWLLGVWGGDWELHAPLAQWPGSATVLLGAVLSALYGLAALQVGDWAALPWRGRERPKRGIRIPVKVEGPR